MPERTSLPVVPLRDTVVFPGVAVRVSAGRPGTIEAIQEALEGEGRALAVAQKDGEDDQPGADALFMMGTVVKIIQTHRAKSGMQLLIQGEKRARVLSYRRTGEYMLQAVAEYCDTKPPGDPFAARLVALNEELRDRSAELGTRRGVSADALNQLIQGVDDPGAFADYVAFYLNMPVRDKQALLEELEDERRIRSALVAVERELARINAQEEIQAKVQEELGERQREMILREHLKQIRKELGEEEEKDENREVEKRLEALKLPKTARKEIDRELRRLRRTPPQSAEYQVIRTFLDWVAELPWEKRTADKIDLRRSFEILEEDHYGLNDVKDRVVEFLAVRKLQQERFPKSDASEEESDSEEDAAEKPAENGVGEAGPSVELGEGVGEEGGEGTGEDVEGGEAETKTEEGEGDEAQGSEKDGQADPFDGYGKAPILLFLGPPGVGKTSIARSIARSVGRKYVRISLGGARDEADIRGHRRTYVGAQPGRIVQGMREAGSMNPVFLLDEVDKLGVSFQGDPSSALLEVLDPAQNSTFVDHYLGVPFDLSEVLFVATANYVDRIPPPLRDRMETVDFRGYTEQEKLQIAVRYLLPRQIRLSGLMDDEVQISDGAILGVIRKYTREAGVRQLERQLGKLARKVARKVASEETKQVVVNAKVTRELLGRARERPEQRASEDVVGVATGMFYTPMGGDIMFVEASIMPGEGELVLTGQLGDVMRESARAALSYAKSNWKTLGIDEHALGKSEVHIHVPAGAIPKDGPSAGITMATALVSAVAKRKVRSDIAMTGELTLTGRVLPIGGVKEKVLGAVRAGIHDIVIPKDNETDLEDLPEAVRAELTVHLVDDLHKVVEIAVKDASANGAKAKADATEAQSDPESPS